MKLTENLRERYSRMLALRDFSEEDMETVMKTTVAMVGAGGLGSPALRLLAAIGFGRIMIVDRDVVELSNIQRQTVYNTKDIGRPKAEAAAENLEMMNPNVEYEPICASISEGNSVDILRGADIIVDGLDSFKARRALNRASLSLSIPYVFAGAVEYYANLSTFVPGETGCLQCVMGNAEDNPENTCARVGVSPTLLSIASSVQVNEALLVATGRTPHLANHLMAVEISTMSFDVFDIGRVEDCPECSHPQKRPAAREEEVSATLLCSNSYNVTPPADAEVDLDYLHAKLAKHVSVKRSKRALSITFSEGPRVTLMAGGNAIVKNVSSADEAKEYYMRATNPAD
jgi:molybdopterin/thiamine biosynthesis adenylyltransferase